MHLIHRLWHFLANRFFRPVGILIAASMFAIGMGPSPFPEAHGREFFPVSVFQHGAKGLADLVFLSGFEDDDLAACSPEIDAGDDGLLDAACIIEFVPPDPGEVATPIDPTVATDFSDANHFLAFGADPVQKGVAPNTINDYQAAVLRGRVLDSDQLALAGVLVRVLDHPEFGYTYTREDGYYDMLINGGGDVVIDFQKTGLLRAQRRVTTPWQDWALADDVVMLPMDPVMTPIVLGPAAPAQLAQGSVSNDEDGDRQATVFFPAGTEATMTLPNGSQVPLPALDFRATEYTIGEQGPQRMPGALPPTSAYTYAMELSADQALAAGATRVEFNQPVSFYVENFLGFEVGGVVPAGWYDYRAGNWVPSDNGRVIKLLGVTDGLAEIDIDGMGIAADVTALDELGITPAERARLAQTYDTDVELWRVPMDHLTPYDCNWPYVPPDDAEPPPIPPVEDGGDDPGPDGPPDGDEPSGEDPSPEPKFDDEVEEKKDEPCEEGSIISCESQTLGLSVPVAGTPFSLQYRSSRADAPEVSQRKIKLKVSLTGPYPDSLKRIRMSVSMLGRTIETMTPVLAGVGGQQPESGQLNVELARDDVYGRHGWQGAIPFTATLSYGYQPMYATGVAFQQAFARVSGLPSVAVARNRVDNLVEISRTWTSAAQWRSTSVIRGPEPWNAKGLGLGGWMLDAQRALDPVSMSVRYGDGRKQVLSPEVVERSAEFSGGPGDSILDYSNAVSAAGAVLRLEQQIRSADSGNSYSVWQRVKKLLPNGQQQVVIESCIAQYFGGVPAQNGASIKGGAPYPCPEGTQQWEEVERIEVDARDRIVLAGADQVYRVGTDLDVEALGTQYSEGGTIAEWCSANGFGSVAGMASHGDRIFLACGASIFVIDGEFSGLYAGGGGDSGDYVPVFEADLGTIGSMAAGPDGSLYIYANNRIRRIGVDGIVSIIAGNGLVGPSVDGQPALTQPMASVVNALSVDRTGTVSFYQNHIAPGESGKVRIIGQDGMLYTLMGGGPAAWDAAVPRVPARSIALDPVIAINTLPDGSVVLADQSALLRFGPPSLKQGTAEQISIPEIDSSRVMVFDRSGRHLETRDATTGALLLAFQYNANGQLVAIVDGDGDQTTITRGAEHIHIDSADGVRTTLELDGNGWVHRVQLPESVEWLFDSDPYGLITHVRTPKQQDKYYQWHPLAHGRLLANVDAAGQTWPLTRKRINARDAETGWRTSPSGRASSHSRQLETDGGVRHWINQRDGSWMVMQSETTGNRSINQSDGSSIEQSRAYDPLFAFDAPYVSQSVGRGALVQTTRTAESVGTGVLGQFNRTFTTSVDGRVYQRQYDSVTRTWTSTSPEGRNRQAILNDRGRLQLIQQPGLAPVEYQYDARGRLTSVLAGEGAEQRVSSFGYDSYGYLAWAEDPLGRRVNYSRDALGRPNTITLPDDREIGLSWDANSNLIGLTPPGRSAHQFNYTATDHLASYQPPAAGAGLSSTAYPRDLDQELTQVQRPDGQILSMARKPGSTQLASVSWPGGQRHFSYGFDVASDPPDTRLVGIDAPLSNDLLGFLWDEEVPTDQIWTGPAVQGQVHYSYGSARRLDGISITGGAAASYGYDLDSLLTSAQLGGQVLTLNRAANTGLLQASSSGVVTATWSYNSFAEPLTYIANISGAEVFASSYTRDALGRIVTHDETVQASSHSQDYSYDLADRLSSVTRDGELVSTYSFDSNSNRSSHLIGLTSPLQGHTWPCLGDLNGVVEVQVNASYDAQDRMSSYGSCSFEYTQNGELTHRLDTATGADTYYNYDVFSNLRQVTLADGRVIDYHIDGLNRRVGKSIDGVRQQGWLYANALEPIAELDAMGNVIASFLYAERPHVPSLMLKGGNAYRIVSDHLGSVRLVINTVTGVIAQRLSYDEYGNVTEDTNPGFQPFGYAGGLYDPDTGLVRFGARDYDALTGRWTSKDPIKFRGGDTNLYAYSYLDPINFADLTGQKPFQLFPDEVSAGVHAINDINPISKLQDWEYAGRICRDPSGKCFYTPPIKGPEPGTSNPGFCPTGSEPVGDYHTHGRNHPEEPDWEWFSYDDKVSNFKEGGISILGTGTDAIRGFEWRPPYLPGYGNEWTIDEGN